MGDAAESADNSRELRKLALMGPNDSLPDYGTGHTIRGANAVPEWKEYPLYDLNWREKVRRSAASVDYWDNADQEFPLESLKQLAANGDELIEMSGGYTPAVRQIQDINFGLASTMCEKRKG